MLKKNTQLITLPEYAADINKAMPSIHRYVVIGAALPGIEEYYKLGKSTYVLKKSDKYKSIVKSIRDQKFIKSEK